MELITYPAPSLFKICQPVAKFDRKLNDFINEMFLFKQSLNWGNPVGLAAPQVGHNIQLFIALDNVYINPEIEYLPGEQYQCKEGCYSLEKDKMDYEVMRYPSIALKWQDKKGDYHVGYFDGFKAQVIQHEYDHLMGRLCIGEK